MRASQMRHIWADLTYGEAERIQEIAGEIYDLCSVLEESCHGDDSVSKGRRIIINQIVDRNTKVYNEMIRAKNGAERDKEELAA